MSMTQEEAINRIKDHMEVHLIGEYPHIKLKKALELAISALRPVSQERVEKAWRGYWIHEEIQSNQSTTGYFKISSCECSKCGYYVQQEANFCPNCGAPMTDEAVDMMLKRMEEIYK